MTGHHIFDVDGKIALVTGSSRGIGLALSTGLVEAGAVVVLNGRDAEALENTRARLAEHTGAAVHAYAFDVTDSAAVAQAARNIENEVGPVEIVVNNTGVQHRAPLLEFTDDHFRRVLETNLSSAFYVGREFARAMVARGHGKIVNICSVQSELGRPGITPYAASKGGLKMLTRGMCADLAPYGLQVNALAPGYFDTELTKPSSTTRTSRHGWRNGRPQGGGDVPRNWWARCCSWLRPPPTSSTGRSCTSTAA